MAVRCATSFGQVIVRRRAWGSSRDRDGHVASGSCHERDDDVGGVSVEVLAASVVDRGGARVGVSRRQLDVTEGDADVERGHDERGAQHVRVHGTEACAFADRTNPPMRGATIEAFTGVEHQDGTVASFPDGKIDRARRARYERNDCRVVALPDDAQGAMPESKPRSSMFVAHASLTRSPFNPNSTVSAACARSTRSAVNKNRPSSLRSRPRPSRGWTFGRRTYWAGLAVIRPSMCANR